MGLVKGFTDIIAPQNLATNGGFRINQRGLRVDTFTSIKGGDYIADCWLFHPSSSVDYVVASQSEQYSNITFKGYGKKGQGIVVANTDYSRLQPYNNTSAVTRSFTAAVEIENGRTAYGATVSVPIEVSVVGRYSMHASYAIPYRKIAKVASNSTGEAVICYQTNMHVINAADVIYITLLADGEFNFTLENFRLLAGNYVNPPKDVGCHLADDLLRCKRYYQSGSFGADVRCISLNTGSASIAQLIPFETQMAGTPTCSIHTGSSSFYASNGDNTSTPDLNASFTAAYPTSKGFKLYVGTDDPSIATLAINNGAIFNCDWVASL